MTVLLLHPIGLDHTFWTHHHAWIAHRYGAIALDLPGHGAAEPVEPPVTLDAMAAHVASVLDTDATGPVDVIGVSMGGMIAQHLALQRPDLVSSLVLCATAGWFPDSTRHAMLERGRLALRGGMDAVIQPTLERWLSPEGRDTALGRRCARTLAVHDPGSWAACWGAIAQLDTLPLLADVPAPALVITGENDTATPPESAAALAVALPNARLVLVPRAHHLAVFEDAQRFQAIFAAFLAMVAGSRSPRPASRDGLANG